MAAHVISDISNDGTIALRRIVSVLSTPGTCVVLVMSIAAKNVLVLTFEPIRSVASMLNSIFGRSLKSSNQDRSSYKQQVPIPLKRDLFYASTGKNIDISIEGSCWNRILRIDEIEPKYALY